MKYSICFLICTLGLTLPALAEDAQWRFEDVTDLVLDKNPPGIGPIFDYAFLDINDDNLLDIVVNNHHRSKPAPIWLGTPKHTFQFWQNMPEPNMPLAGFFLGEVDLNGDGKTDLIYTGNEGGVVANLKTSPSGTHRPSYQPIALKHSSKLVSFADLDGDGQLEALVRPGQVFDSSLTKAVASGFHFGEWTVSDFNNDGWPDLFASGVNSRRKSWSGPRRLFKNDRGSLKEVEKESPLVTRHLGGVVRSGDFNNDGHMDLYVFDSKPTDPNQADEKHYMRLYLGDGNFGFSDVTDSAGIADSKVKSGYSMVYLADIDNDTHLDLVNQGNYGCQVWKNNGDATFTIVPKEEVPWAVNAHMRLDDYDMDGRLDIVTAAAGPGWKDRPTTIRVFRNLIDNGHHWLKIQLRQPGKNTMAVGAAVTIYKPGTQTILGKRLVMCDTTGYHPRLHFGLAQHQEVDVEVRFPGAKSVVKFPRMKANRYVVLRPDGTESDVQFPER